MTKKIYMGEVEMYINDLRKTMLDKSIEMVLKDRIDSIDKVLNLIVQYGKSNIVIK